MSNDLEILKTAGREIMCTDVQQDMILNIICIDITDSDTAET